MTMSVMPKATGRPSARSLRCRRVLESCNLVLLAEPDQGPSYATRGTACPLERFARRFNLLANHALSLQLKSSLFCC